MDDYLPQPRWEYRKEYRGWVGVPITAAEDFTQADMEELI